MTKQEFEARYGKEVSGQMFVRINDLYMSVGDMDKDLFVKDYKKHEESLILNYLYDKSEHQKDEISSLKQQIDYMVDLLITKGTEYEDITLLNVAETEVGKKNVIMRKINRGIGLNDDDLDYIKDNLK